MRPIPADTRGRRSQEKIRQKKNPNPPRPLPHPPHMPFLAGGIVSSVLFFEQKTKNQGLVDLFLSDTPMVEVCGRAAKAGARHVLLKVTNKHKKIFCFGRQGGKGCPNLPLVKPLLLLRCCCCCCCVAPRWSSPPCPLVCNQPDHPNLPLLGPIAPRSHAP